MANNIERQYFLTLFPEFKRREPAAIEAYIGIASQRVPLGVWGGNTPYATALLAAHMLATSGPQGGGSAGGPVVAEQVGDLSRSYQSIAEQGSGDASLMTTRYGIDFVALRKATITTMRTVRKPVIPPFGCG